LTGLALFRASSDAATLHNILHKPVLAPSAVGLKPPPLFDEVCLRALERDPDKRFQTALEMADALRSIAIQERQLGSRREVAEWVDSQFNAEFAARREAIRQAAVRREVEQTGVSVVALPEIAAPLSSPDAAPTTQSVSFEVVELPTSPKPRRLWLVGAALLPLVLAGIGVGVWASMSRPNDQKSSFTEPVQLPAQASKAPAETPTTAKPATPPAEVAAPAAAASAESETPAARTRVIKRYVPPAARPVAQTPVAAPAAAPSRPSPPAASPPARSPAATPSEPAIERNPYLRQR
jgi:eukaryotic-like serine/threonine-protein kinase